MVPPEETRQRPATADHMRAIPLDVISPSVRFRLQRDADTLTQAAHPGIVAPSAHETAEAFVLTRPHVAGEPLAGWLGGRKLSEAEGLALARQLMSALAVVHERGVLHGALSPHNVIIPTGGGPGDARIVEFCTTGPAMPASSASALDRARYGAPEQSGLIDAEVTERADLYAAGLLCYSALAGRHPFAGTNVRDVLREQLTVRPPRLRAAGSRVSRSVEEVIQRLLEKDPSSRYQSAAAVLADIVQIEADLAAGRASSSHVVGRHDRRRTLIEPAFVGRERELADLDGLLEAARKGRGGLAFVEAESGGGKTRLLDEAARRAQRTGAWVVRGQGVDQAASLPLQILEDVAHDIVLRARSEPAFAAAFDERLGDFRQAAVAALPDLKEEWGGQDDAQLGPEAHGEQRSVEALSALLDALADAERPTLVILDDVQWADDLTVRLLSDWCANGGTRHVAVVVAFRSEEVATDHRLRRLDARPHLRLASFDEAHVRQLVESMAGRLPEPALATVARLSEGSPLMASAVLRGLVESRTLVAGETGWEMDDTSGDNMRSSHEAAAFLAKRMTLLPVETLHILSVGAILGKEFDIAEASRLAERAPGAAIDALETARQRHIVWSRADVGRYAFVHDKLRETLLAMMAADDRKRLHRHAAEAIARDHEQAAYKLAYHLNAADDAEAALPFALQAAQTARQRHALAVAEQHYRIALNGADRAPATTRRAILEGLGETLMLRGQYQEAEERLDQARALSDDAVEIAETDAKIGELAFKRGDVTSAREALERGLHALGRSVPRSMLGYGLRASWEGLVQALHTLFPRLFLARRSRADADAEFVAIRLYSRLAYTYWFSKGLVPTGWAHLREMNLAERYPESAELAQAYSEHAPVMTMIPWYARGVDYAERSLAIRQRLGDIWGQGQSFHFHAVVLYADSRYHACIEKSREAVRLLRKTGDQWEVNTANWHIAFSYHRLGEYAKASAIAQEIYQTGRQIGDAQAAGISLGGWAKATDGDVPPQAVEDALATHVDDVHTTGEVAMAAALRARRDGRPGEAVDYLRAAQRRIRKKGLRQEYVAPIHVWLATMLRAQLEATSALDADARRRLRRAHRRAAHHALRVGRTYRNNLPHALREAAYAAAFANRPQRARSLLEASVATARQQTATREEGFSLAALAELGQMAGWPETETWRHQAEAILDERHVTSGDQTLSLIDRFETILDEGRRIVGSLTADAVTDAAHVALRQLVRAESTGELAVIDGHVDAPAGAADFLTNLAEEALARQQAVRLASIDRDAHRDAGGILSAIAVPVVVQGRPARVLYATNRALAGAFDEEDERVAGFVAALTGAALESAQGFHALSDAHDNLRFQKELLERQGEAAIDGILVVGADGRVLSHNARLCQLWDLEEAAVKDGHHADVLAAIAGRLRDSDAFLADAERISGDSAAHTRDELVSRDGLVFDRYSAPVPHAAGGHARVWFFRDITREREAADILKASNDRLTELTKLKTQLLNTASHELNTPLTPLKIQVRLLKSGSLGDLTESQAKGVAVIDRNVERLQKLVQDLLDVSRIEGGQLSVRPTLTDVTVLVREAAEAFEAATSQQEIGLTIHTPESILAVADAGRLSQVVFNLVGNAVKFTPSGGRIAIHLESDEAHIHVRVVDDGIGFVGSDGLFDAFVQLHDDTPRGASGTGLGLFISKGIVARHGGNIWGRSAGEGQGSEFGFTIPLAGPATAPAAIADASERD